MIEEKAKAMHTRKYLFFKKEVFILWDIFSLVKHGRLKLISFQRRVRHPFKCHIFRIIRYEMKKKNADACEVIEVIEVIYLILNFVDVSCNCS